VPDRSAPLLSSPGIGGTSSQSLRPPPCPERPPAPGWHRSEHTEIFILYRMGFRAFLQIAAPAWPYRVTTPQILSFALIGLTVATFAWGRFRYDTVSLVALLVAILIGIVPVKQAFTGFTSDVVVIIAAALVISAGVARSGVVEATLAPASASFSTCAAPVPASPRPRPIALPRR
jgi:hypothetical protein